MRIVRGDPEDFFGELKNQKILNIEIKSGNLVIETEKALYCFLHKVTKEEDLLDWSSADINVCYKTIK